MVPGDSVAGTGIGLFKSSSKLVKKERIGLIPEVYLVIESAVEMDSPTKGSLFLGQAL